MSACDQAPAPAGVFHWCMRSRPMSVLGIERRIIAGMPRYDTESKNFELSGPAPCDACRYRQRCAISGEACLSFSEYCRGVKEHRWQLMPKQPRFDIGKRLGVEARPLPENPTVMPWEGASGHSGCQSLPLPPGRGNGAP